ncbi:hypothetical protein IFM89_013288 [Coptis chinensis]|uniref:Uncharacterized protein n=1 Tax=Coptis chinensis TaxID=261450 RepID=A0A835IVU5_9MAGN|nr:hypothetical protein IFM89_013288 [Coptis chinensis]
MPLLDKILDERASLFDYELTVGDHGRVEWTHELSILKEQFSRLSKSWIFNTFPLTGSILYVSFSFKKKAAVIVVAEEIATLGLPSGICPFVFIFTGLGNGIDVLLKF